MNPEPPPDLSPAELGELGKPSRSPLPIMLAFVAGVAIGGGGVVALTTALETDAPDPAASASASAAPEPAPSAPPSAAPPPPTPEEQAARGDEKAMEALSGKPIAERTSEQTLALAQGKRAQKIEQIAELKRKIELLPKYGREKPGHDRIMKLARDREVSTETLEMLASLPGEIGPDLLYEVWTGRRRATATTQLAEELVYSTDVRKKASKALDLALELRVTEDCEAMKKLLEQAIEIGDRRSLVPIVKLNNKRGCGEKKRDDCWKCLRKTDLLKDAVTAVRGRRAP